MMRAQQCGSQTGRAPLDPSHASIHHQPGQILYRGARYGTADKAATAAHITGAGRPSMRRQRWLQLRPPGLVPTGRPARRGRPPLP
jgi:hypothetical protein